MFIELIRIENVGYCGTVCFLLSYALVQLGRMDGNGIWYTTLNALGCIFMLISLHGAWNAPVFLNNCLSLTISILGFRRHYLNERKKVL